VYEPLFYFKYFRYVIPNKIKGIMFRIITEGSEYSEYVILKSGLGILLRSVKPEDKPLLREFMNRISQESLRMRFMASLSVVSDELINSLCFGNSKTDGCIVALTGEDDSREIIGIGNYNGIGNGKTAEVSFLIQDNYQGLGISTLLLERLAGLAAANGYVEFEAEVLPENQSMINVFKNSGFESHQVWHSDTVHVELPVNGAAAMWERANLRERFAVANSLRAILHPKSIAVIGASKDENSIGTILFKNIINAGFSGTVYPINQQANSVNGVKAFASVKELPEEIDLAVIAVPAEAVYDVAYQSIKNGAKGLIVVSAGFSEAGDEGKARQAKLVKLVKAKGVRLVGPSCLGVINTNPDVKLNASLASGITSYGNVAFFSHSAALGLVIMNYASEIGITFSTFVSAGNRADVSGNDLLLYWEDDPDTKMVMLYLETFGNPRRFTRIARRMSYKKPILCVKTAKSNIGRKRVEAKTSGLFSGEINIVKALFTQTGVIVTETIEELFHIALVLSSQELPEGNRASIIANSSGMTTIFADACESNGINLGENAVNDLGAFTQPENYRTAVRDALIDDNIDALLVGYACVGNCSSQPVAAAILKGVQEAESVAGKKKTVILCLTGKTGAVTLTDDNKNERTFPAFRFPEAAARALGKIVKYVAFKKRPAGKLQWYDDVDANKARKLIQGIIENNKTDEKTIKLKTEDAKTVFNLFRLNIDNGINSTESKLEISVVPDKLFGPLIKIKKFSGEEIIRITPLTESDIEETIEELKCEKKICVKDVLGRISQMIEELPWLWQLEAKIIIRDEEIFLTAEKIILKLGKYERPVY
jgi:acyl-CoA synthetase (NDP forming)/RimJ/RimL family protein N-acetyltransferase